MLRCSTRKRRLFETLPQILGCAGIASQIGGAHQLHGRWYTKGAPQQSQGRQPDKGVDGEIEVLYKGRWMLPFRVLVRLKMFQLGGVAACAVPLGTLLTEGGPTMASLGVAGGLLLGCGISATTLQYYSRRYVGELALVTRHPSDTRLRFSVLDFWGNREDNLIPMHELVPPLKGVAGQGLTQMARQPLIPVQVDGDRQYYVSLRHGVLVQKATLMRILEGRHSSQHE